MSCHSTHVGIAATQYAKAITELDDAQVSSIFHRLKKQHAHVAPPTQEEVVSGLLRMQRDVAADDRLPEHTRARIVTRIDKALTAVGEGNLPDGRTWMATSLTAIEAEVAQTNLNRLLDQSARHQRKNGDRLAATFRKWRRVNDYEDMESPDPRFRPDVDALGLPCDKHTRRALRKLGFESYLAQRKPVFVYGTLRRNQGNDRLMNNAIETRYEGAEVSGIAIYGPDRGFPYAMEAPDGHGITRGDLVYLTADQEGDWARQSLDNLEGFDSDRFHDSHYRRMETLVSAVDPATGKVHTASAWVYLAGTWSQQHCTEESRIPDGDWVQAREEYRENRNRGGAFTLPGGYTHYFHDETEDDPDVDLYTGDYVVKKAAADPNGPAAASAAAFEQAGLLD